ncbi:carbohydrate ABC transporter permease [Treponema sp. C6A8]|uniref:carbohydrate ABC transporter permease n=1 Tax=Treponema sp. C6A8 TaxID=1410609 RepID=UPI000AC413D7|nr:sugar ABC transporter permease [Treponema sp. C6A8]
MCIYNSFRKWNGISKHTSFTGLKNYIKLLTDDPSFVHALAFTFLYAFFVVIFINALAILLALLLERDIKAKGAFRMAFYIPNIISLIIIGFIWKFICIRVFEAFGSLTGMGFWNLSWLGDSKLAVVTTIFVSVWQGLGFYLIIYIAGLQSVPDELIEAALIDGAGAVRRLFSVTLPMIMPSISFCMFYSVANSMKMFELIFSLTGGGPGVATTPIALDIYNTAFNNNNFGYGSAKSVVLFIIVCTISVIQVKFFKSKEVES